MRTRWALAGIISAQIVSQHGSESQNVRKDLIYEGVRSEKHVSVTTCTSSHSEEHNRKLISPAALLVSSYLRRLIQPPLRTEHAQTLPHNDVTLVHRLGRPGPHPGARPVSAESYMGPPSCGSTTCRLHRKGPVLCGLGGGQRQRPWLGHVHQYENKKSFEACLKKSEINKHNNIKSGLRSRGSKYFIWASKVQKGWNKYSQCLFLLPEQLWFWDDPSSPQVTKWPTTQSRPPDQKKQSGFTD